MRPPCDRRFRSAQSGTTEADACGLCREVVQNHRTPQIDVRNKSSDRPPVIRLRRRYARCSQDFARVLSLSARVDLDHRRDGCEASLSRATERLSGGGLNAALANELGKLIADFTGRGATKSRALVHQDLVVCVFEDGATRAERNLVAAGKSEPGPNPAGRPATCDGAAARRRGRASDQPHGPHVPERHRRGGRILDRGVSTRARAGGNRPGGARVTGPVPR